MTHDPAPLPSSTRRGTTNPIRTPSLAAWRTFLHSGDKDRTASSLKTPSAARRGRTRRRVRERVMRSRRRNPKLAKPNKVKHVFSPLMVVCCAHSLKCMKGGASVKSITPNGKTILMEAVDDGLTEIVKLLLEAGTDPSIADEIALPSLAVGRCSCACDRHHPALVLLLHRPLGTYRSRCTRLKCKEFETLIPNGGCSARKIWDL